VENEASAEIDAFEPRLAFTYRSGLTNDALERRVAALPEHAIIYFLLFYQDAGGVNVNPLEYVERLAALANRPTYSWIDSTLDRGVVGGSLLGIEAQLEAIAGLAGRVLRGEAANAIPVATIDLHVRQVDWRQLRRWGIDVTRVPAGVRIRFREPSIWERYRIYVLVAAVVLVLETALIAGLLVQARCRRRAEAQMRASQAALRASYERIHDLGRRLIVAQEAERSRIARELHDDISQRMAGLAIDLELLSGVGSKRPESFEALARQAMGRAHEIARNLHDISRRLHPAKLRLIGLVAALGSLQRELTQPGMVVTFSHDAVPTQIPHDLALCLYRVAQEALQNAIKYSGAREVAVELRGVPGGIELTVTDQGVGFDVQAVADRGLGLISMGERLEQFGGTLKIHSAPRAGTRLNATIPFRADSPANVVASA
jgi:signal transduction histidine kinase